MRSPDTDCSPWYKDAVIYEVHVRTFCDGNGDGIGDFPGLTQKLGYLQDLGVTAVWLLPFYPSPLRDEGYDIANYTDVHRDYGTLRDFKFFLREAHRRGLRVITELVLNHTSDEHAWFQRARRAPPGSSGRSFYVWSDNPEHYKGARIIFEDFESSNWAWDPVAHAYYWHRFYSHQPDLNYRNPAVIRAIEDVLDFWLELGVDGLRLDAVPYLVEAEGTSSENLPETHGVLKRLRRHVDDHFENRMLLAEANQWPEDAAAYFGHGDEAHMAFHFPLMPRLFMSLQEENRFPVVDVLAQTPQIPEICQWALFLRNHDELTLEMVTEEERLFMYHAYTKERQARINLGIRRRLAPLLGNDRRKIELMNALLFSLPGTPVIYYGDEIGMGDNFFLGDRNGIRTPMQWSGDCNAGFSSADPQRLCLPLIVDYEYHHQTVHVEAQERNRESLLWWMRRMLALRKRHPAFSRGGIEFCHPANQSIIAFVRCWKDEAVLLVANLSRFHQCAELDLSGFERMVPVELSSRNRFPSIDTAPYRLTLGPHGFLWLALEKSSPTRQNPAREIACNTEHTVQGPWENLVTGKERTLTQEFLPNYLRSRPWFTRRASRILDVSITAAIPITSGKAKFFLTLLHVEYAQREPEMYVLPIGWAAGAAAEHVLSRHSDKIICRASVHAHGAGSAGILYDPIVDRAFTQVLLRLVTRRQRAGGASGWLDTIRTPALRGIKLRKSGTECNVLIEELSNSTLLYGNTVVVKLFRRVGEGDHPEFVIGDFLTRRRSRCTATTLGLLNYHRPRREPVALAVLQRFVPNQSDAWQHMLKLLRQYRTEIKGQRPPQPMPPLSPLALLEASRRKLPNEAVERLRKFLPLARQLGRRTSELHRILGSADASSYLMPEPFTQLYRRSYYQSLRALTGSVIRELHQFLPQLSAGLRPFAERVTSAESEILAKLRPLLERKIVAVRIACHGNYHLQQILRAGTNLTIIDFEGEPTRPLFERRLKRTPLTDIASMVRSFHYAASAVFSDLEEFPWSAFWRHWIAAAFLQEYFSAVDRKLLPASPDDIALLFELCFLERLLYELGNELACRPEWIAVPLRDLAELLGNNTTAHHRSIFKETAETGQ